MSTKYKNPAGVIYEFSDPHPGPTNVMGVTVTYINAMGEKEVLPIKFSRMEDFIAKNHLTRCG